MYARKQLILTYTMKLVITFWHTKHIYAKVPDPQTSLENLPHQPTSDQQPTGVAKSDGSTQP
jgi:hypothetical protein